MPPSDFVHLHLHTQYSLLDGAIQIEPLFKKAKEFGMPAVAITDHGNLFGGIEFYQAGVKAGIKPILGCEVYIQSQGSRHDKTVRRGFEPYHHLILLAMNLEGYQNLCKLISIGHLEGFYYKPRIDKESLRAHSKGLICLSGCLSGELAEAALQNGLSGARRVAEEFQQIFGDRFYLEIQENHIPSQTKVNAIVQELSPALSIPMVATNDSHYLYPDHARAHEVLLCIQTGKTLQDQDRMRFDGDEFYLRSPEEMGDLFKQIPESLQTTVDIAARCDLELKFNTYYFPKYESPAGKGLDEFLEEEVWKGFEERWPLCAHSWKEEEREEKRKHYEARLRDELAMIRKMGFSGYFLIVADFINFAKSQKIPVGPGRGSAAGSLVAYCLKITDIDPLPYNLLFERFLNPERVSMPDMDIDFCMDRRDEVIQYVQKKYGNVSQIITFGKMKAKAVVRDVARVMNLPYKEADQIAKLIPNALNITLEEALKQEPRLKEMEDKNPKVKELLSYARSLEGLNRHASTHAAGVVISDRPLVELMPLYRGQHDEIVTQYDMKAIEKIGLIKFDFLGLKTLTVLDQAVKIIRRTRGVEISLNELPLDDPEVYKSLAAADTLGIFQLESSGMKDLLVRMKSTAFPDLIALVALYRPGPLGSGMVDEFINRKHGRVQARYELPQLEPILRETHGVIVYQEQVMQIASVLANFSLGDADILRRAMGKKKPEEMAEQRDKFLEGCQKNKIPAKKAEKIFDLMAKFAEYGFNKSHSAAYAFISYQTAYLKTHYPVEYMASLLTHEMGNTDKVMAAIQDCRDHGIAILPPDINSSFHGFSVVSEKEIRFGLAAVKNVGGAAIESIIEARKRVESFRSFRHVCEEVDLRRVNRRVIESLIKCGTFDSLGISRSQAFALLDSSLEEGSRKQKRISSGQSALFETGAVPKDETVNAPAWSEQEKLSFEKESLGFYISGHPLSDFTDSLRERATTDIGAIREMNEEDDEKLVTFGAVVTSLREITTKSGNRMAFVSAEDLKGSLPVIVFSDLYQKVRPLLSQDRPLLIRGTVKVEEENVKVVAKEIITLQGGGGTATTREVHFHLPRHGVTPEQLERLKNLLRNHQGNATAYLHLKESEKEETVLMLPEGLKVNPSVDLLKEVDGLFGSPVTIVQ